MNQRSYRAALHNSTFYSCITRRLPTNAGGGERWESKTGKIHKTDAYFLHTRGFVYFEPTQLSRRSPQLHLFFLHYEAATNRRRRRRKVGEQDGKNTQDRRVFLHTRGFAYFEPTQLSRRSPQLHIFFLHYEAATNRRRRRRKVREQDGKNTQDRRVFLHTQGFAYFEPTQLSRRSPQLHIFFLHYEAATNRRRRRRKVGEQGGKNTQDRRVFLHTRGFAYFEPTQLSRRSPQLHLFFLHYEAATNRRRRRRKVGEQDGKNTQDRRVFLHTRGFAYFEPTQLSRRSPQLHIFFLHYEAATNRRRRRRKVGEQGGKNTQDRRVFFAYARVCVF